MQNFVIEMLPNVITTEPVTYLLIVKFLSESGFEDYGLITWEFWLQNVQLMSWINRNLNDQALILV